jgi:hypothetical protein
VGHVFRQPLAVKHSTGELLLLPLLRSLLRVLQVLLLGSSTSKRSLFLGFSSYIFPVVRRHPSCHMRPRR